MTLEGHPTMCIYDDELLRSKMMEDYIDRKKMSSKMANNELLKDIAYK
jgi:hypothetical protein